MTNENTTEKSKEVFFPSHKNQIIHNLNSVQFPNNYGSDPDEIKAYKIRYHELKMEHELVLENENSALLVIDTGGKILKSNHEFVKISGFSKEELFCQKYQSVVKISASDNLKRDEVPYFDLDNCENLESYEIKIMTKKGELIPALMKAAVIRKNPVKDNKYYFFINIGNSKESIINEDLEQIRERQKIESVGILAAGIAHDFNNILGAIMGFTELSSDLVPANNNELKNNLDQILKASMRAKELVNQILSFSRHTEKEMKQIKLSSIIKETIKFLKASLPSTISIRHRLEIENDYILGDAVQIHQVIMNLCTNAVHAMIAHGGILMISMENSFPQPDDNGYINIVVSDTGDGMDEKTLSNIFMPFFTTKKKRKWHRTWTGFCPENSYCSQRNN